MNIFETLMSQRALMLGVSSFLMAAVFARKDSKLKIKGHVGESFRAQVEAPRPEELAGHDQFRKPLGPFVADQVVAVPIVDGQIELAQIKNDSVRVPIQSDGSFELEVNRDDANEWVLVLLDSQAADAKSSIVGFVSVPASGRSPVRIPAARHHGELNLGLLTRDGEMALAWEPG